MSSEQKSVTHRRFEITTSAMGFKLRLASRAYPMFLASWSLNWDIFPQPSHQRFAADARLDEKLREYHRLILMVYYVQITMIDPAIAGNRLPEGAAQDAERTLRIIEEGVEALMDFARDFPDEQVATELFRIDWRGYWAERLPRE